MKISIITVCKNAEGVIKRTIESVLSQTYRDIEYIVVDGGSSDGTVMWLSKLSTVNSESVNGEEGLSLNPSSKVKGLESTHDSPLTIHFISQPDTGIYNAMNKGTELATGDFLLFLNAGDYLVDNNVVSEVVENIDKDKSGGDIYFGDIISEDPDTGERYQIPNRLNNINATKLFFWSVPHASAFIKKDALTKVGGYDESFKIAADYDFFVKAFVVENMKYSHIPLDVSVFQTGGISSDPRNKKMLKNENLKIIKKYYGTFPALIYNVTPVLVVLRFIYKVWLKLEKNR